ncbi:hypothetical protein ACROYT_G004182 [Oculina patagonica]
MIHSTTTRNSSLEHYRTLLQWRCKHACNDISNRLTKAETTFTRLKLVLKSSMYSTETKKELSTVNSTLVATSTGRWLSKTSTSYPASTQLA